MCSNPSCGKSFSNPLKVSNLGSKSVKPYEACPYCLTEIAFGTSDSVEVNHDSESEKIRADRYETVEVKVDSVQPEKGSHCTYHFGYLSQRSSKEKIPDECMMCENIVKCMLKAVTS